MEKVGEKVTEDKELTRIVVVGGGYAGVHACQRLAKALGQKSGVEITLINPGPSHTLLTDLHEVAGNRIPPEGVEVSIRKVFAGKAVNFVEDRIVRIDPQKQILYSESHEYPYDYVILACGSEPAYYNIPGMKENALSLWSLKDAERIRRHVREMFRLAASEKDAVKRQELLTFVVGGGGFTGVEMIGELADWVPDLCGEYGLSEFDVNLILIEALPTILPNLRRSLAERARRYMRARGITVLTNSPIVEVTPEEVSLKSGTKIRTRTVIWTGGVQTNHEVQEFGFKCHKRGRVRVNEFLQVEGYSNIYAVGDNACFMTHTGELPALVEAGLQGGACAAENIARQVKGEKPREFRPKLHGVMVSIGAGYAVADIAGIPLWGLPAVAMKHLVNLHYLFGVGGMWLVNRYLRLEFLNERGTLAPVFKHLTVKTSVVWLVILRLFLGYQWLVSGIHKVQSGFLVSGDKLVSGSSLVPMGPGTPQFYVTFMEKVVFPHALFFQIIVTLGELAIGTALILGLFTALAGLGSIFMNVNFMLSGTGNVWFLVTSLLMLGGAGRAFGLDYYVMPFLEGLWRERRPVAKQKSATA
ncbi:MAG TPA: FAD-dependent oxidoreductase [Firmicutes bacterium]|nr:FAD-dependent oxidoreductase [Bacillota bacterium]